MAATIASSKRRSSIAEGVEFRPFTFHAPCGISTPFYGFAAVETFMTCNSGSGIPASPRPEAYLQFLTPEEQRVAKHGKLAMGAGTG